MFRDYIMAVKFKNYIILKSGFTVIKNLSYAAVFSLVLASLSVNVFAKGSAEAGKAKTTTCVACHGEDGNAPIAVYPKLAGQYENYLLKTLLAYKALSVPDSEAATHKSANAQIMYSQIMSLSDQDLEDLAAFFSSQKTSNGETAPNYYEMGRKLYMGGDLERGIPACAACHSPTGMGNDLANFPKLSGQHSEYIKSQLMAFKNDERINDMMQIVAKKLTDEDMAAVSSYASGLH